MKNKIFTIRDKQVILDRDLAELYGISTKSLNQAVKRNFRRFPPDFMLKLDTLEKMELVTKCDHLNELKYSSQLPYAFTEQGVAMLAGILNSDKAIEVNIQIMRAFVIMRKFISSNIGLFERIDNAEQKLLEHDEQFSKVFGLIEDKGIKPEKGIFFNGQIFDAYNFVADLIRTAKSSIILIDNYVDDSILTMFSKRNKRVKVIILTKLSKQLNLDLDKHNSQYEPIEVKEFNDSHDRFLIIDEIVYHFGASLKDLGNKWFACSKFEQEGWRLLNKLNEILKPL